MERPVMERPVREKWLLCFLTEGAEVFILRANIRAVGFWRVAPAGRGWPVPWPQRFRIEQRLLALISIRLPF